MDLVPFTRGKVRDVYDLGDRLLIVTSDRISAYDVVMNEPIPDKGKILSAMSLFWFDLLAGLCRHHLITGDVEGFPEEVREQAAGWKDRAMLVTKAQRIDFECVVRGYITGSLWSEYKKARDLAPGRAVQLYGYEFPPDLRESQKLPEPIFTPATKADTGHDENVSYEFMSRHTGDDTARQLRRLSLRIYTTAAEYAAGRGIIIADTKFEFGWKNGEIILIDEVLSPDSSRFWPLEGYQPGRSQDSYDKQYLRDYLTQCQWNKTPPPPPLPEEVILRTRAKYVEAYERLVPEARRTLRLS